jgi:hypothetical protein
MTTNKVITDTVSFLKKQKKIVPVHTMMAHRDRRDRNPLGNK